MTDQLFVYGTLKQSFDNPFARLLSRSGNFVGRGLVNGRLYQLKDYPGLVLSGEPGEYVYGELYEIGRDHQTWKELDSYEGCGEDDVAPFEFERQELPVFLEDGARITANAYVYRGVPDDSARIASGTYNPAHQHEEGIVVSKG